VLCLYASVSAQSRNLTLVECLRVAEERDPQTRADSLSREGASLQERTQKTAWMPSLNASVSYNRLSELDASGITLPLPAALGGPKSVIIAPDIPNQYGASLRVDQLLWDGNRSKGMASASRHEQSSWGAAREKSRRDLSARVAAAYWNLGAAQAAMEAARTAMARADSQANLTAIAFREGTALEQDTLQARLRARQIEIQLEQANASREFALQTLCIAMGRPLSYDVRGLDALKPLDAVPAPAHFDRPELEQVREQILSAQELVVASRSSYQPVVQASAQYDFLNPNPRIVPNHEDFDGTWRVGVAATWNLYRGGADELSVRKSELAVQQARQREAILQDVIGQELSRRETELHLARRKREIAERNLPLARRDLELAIIRSQAGTALRLEAIDRASALAQLESDLAQAVALENIAAMNLSIARGVVPRWN
jgi:outer membrane protein TolC